MDLHTGEISTIPNSEGLFAPRWSPDGKRIVAQDTSGHGLMLYEIASQKWSELVPRSPTHIVMFPQWSMDGTSIYYWRYGPSPGVYIIRIKDSKTERLADLTGIAQVGNLGGLWGAVDPDGNPLILRMAHMDEIFALDLDLP